MGQTFGANVTPSGSESDSERVPWVSQRSPTAINSHPFRMALGGFSFTTQACNEHQTPGFGIHSHESYGF
jgi:hypothetical protein